MSSIVRLERKQKNSLTAYRICTFLFRSYLFGIETINTFTHSRCLRADVSYFLCCTRKTKEIGDVCMQANILVVPPKPYPIPDQNGQSVFDKDVNVYCVLIFSRVLRATFFIINSQILSAIERVVFTSLSQVPCKRVLPVVKQIYWLVSRLRVLSFLMKASHKSRCNKSGK